MLNRLMRRAVFAKSDAVVRQHVNDLLFHQRGQPDRGAHVIGKDEERAAIRDEAAVQRDAVHDRAHRMFADAVADVASGKIISLRVAVTVQIGVVRWRKIGGAAHQRRNDFDDGVENLPGGDARGDRFFRRKRGNDFFPFIWNVFGHHQFPFIRQIRERLRIRGKLRLPGAFGFRAVFHAFAEMRQRLFRHEKRLLRRPAQRLFRQLDLLRAERRAVRFVRILLIRAAVRDVGFRANQRRARCFVLRRFNRRRDDLRVFAMLDAPHVPAVGFKTPRHIFSERQARAAVNRDAVVVVQADELAEFQMPGERGGF